MGGRDKPRHDEQEGVVDQPCYSSVMGRAVRPTAEDAIRALSKLQLDAYIAETKRRIGMATKAAIRDSYRKQLRRAEMAKAERFSE
jgi:hypothetical protein